MKNMKINLIALGILTASVLFTSCKKNEPVHDHNDEEVITTLKLNFTPNGGGNTLTYQFRDPDGPGGIAPTQDVIVLAPSTIYSVTLELLNESENPVHNLTPEIRAEGTSHRFYYEPSSGSNIVVTPTDTDANGVPVGLSSAWSTGPAPSTGTVAITCLLYTSPSPRD